MTLSVDSLTEFGALSNAQIFFACVSKRKKVTSQFKVL